MSALPVPGGAREATAPTIDQAGEPRLQRLESLRALAASSVLVGHTFQLSRSAREDTTTGFAENVVLAGGYGVFLFFVLSGYLLFWPFARRDFGSGERIDLRRYAINRALRILPLYYVVIVTLLVVQESGGSAEQWWRFLLFAENFSQETVTTVNGVVWSLVVELHFYAALPFLAAGLAAAARGSRRRALVLLLALAAASVVLRYVTQSDDPPPSLWRYSLPATFFFFAAGMALALVRLAWQERRPAWVAGPLGTPAVWLLAAAAVSLAIPWRLGFEADLASVVAGVLVVGACVLPLREGGPLRALDWRPLAALGTASYSLYLWHPPIVEALTDGDDRYATLLPVAAVLSVAAAVLSFRLIETPFLRLRRRWAAPASSPAADPS